MTADPAVTTVVEARRLLDLAREAERGLRGPDAGTWLEQLDSHHGQLRAARLPAGLP